jgi:2-methylaconitate cis-trans-isomerase PrpF
MLETINCTILRGGTSKGVYLLESDLPKDPELRDKIILAIFGSPDKRQIDGLGGADPLTSKVAIVGPSTRPGIDVEYTFGQVSIDQPKVLYHSMCGNITSGVGVFAINNGLVKPVDGITRLRMYNRNTGKVIITEVPVSKGRAVVEGDYVIAGVPGSGAKVTVDFSDTVGALTGKGLLPTGNTRDLINVIGIGEIEVSVVDIAACQIFIRAKDIGLTGRETPQQVDSNPELLRKLEAIRAHGTYIAGLSSTEQSATTERRNTPHLVIVGEVSDYTNYLTGEIVRSEEIDILARMMFMQIMHKTYAGTGSICTSVAAKIPGTIANEYFCSKNATNGLVRIGHPSGIITVESNVVKKGNELIVERAAIGRTARVIMEGKVYLKKNLFV